MKYNCGTVDCNGEDDWRVRLKDARKKKVYTLEDLPTHPALRNDDD